MPLPNPSDNRSSDSEYLRNLEFDPALRRGVFHFFVTRPRVVLLAIALLSVWGVFAYRELPRESNPEVKIPIAVVSVPFPGASPLDVEELVTKKIEAKANSVSGVKQITSTSANSLSSTTVEFEAGEPLDEAIRNLRDAIETVRTDIPEDADDPIVSEISFDDQPILTIGIKGEGDGFALRALADQAATELEKIPGIREARVSGGDEREISVAYIPERLSALGVSIAEANRAIASTNRAVPGGVFDGESFSYPVRTDARFFTAETLAALPVRFNADGSSVILRDIARVEETARERTTLSRLSIGNSEPENAATIDIVKRTGGNIIQTVQESRETMERLAKDYPEGVRWTVTVDFAEEIRKNFSELGRDFIITVVLVMGTLFLIVGAKEALIAGLAIPLAFFTTFGVMLLSGTSLNFLSLFSLLLSLGLLVDDAIVVVSATKQYLRTGKFTPEEAVLLVLRDFKVVLVTTTLTTVWAFLPLLLATGIIGQFIRSIPITVSVMLSASLAIALFVNHPLAAALERLRLTRAVFLALLGALVALGAFSLTLPAPLNIAGIGVALALFVRATLWYWVRNGRTTLERNKLLSDAEWQDDALIREKLRDAGKESENWRDRLLHGIVRFNRIIPVYERALRFVLETTRRKWTTLLGTFALFVVAISLPALGIVRSEFFPPSDEELVFVTVEAPIGTRIEKTDAIVRGIEKRLVDFPDIKNFSSVVGSPGFSQDGPPVASGSASHLAGITVRLSDEKERDIPSYVFADRLGDELEHTEGATVRVNSLQGGPPSGSAFEARVLGDDLKTLERTANELKAILASVEGATNAKISLKDAPADYTFRLDPARLALFQLDAGAVGSALRTAVSGSKITTVLRGGDDIDIIAKIDQSVLPTLADLSNLEIENAVGNRIPLSSIARIELVPSVASITRIDERRTVILSADALGETPPARILADFQKKLEEDNPLPDGYSIEYGGENEQNEESVQSILQAIVIAIFLIVATLIIQFNSVTQAVIVLATLPLALIGVFFGLGLFDIALSFPGLIGVLALMGIVVKNAIILIDKMNLNWRSGIRGNEAIVDAGKSRLEAIFITSLSTIFGLIPITLADELWRALGSTIIFGLAVSSFFTLFIIPILSSFLRKKHSHRHIPIQSSPRIP